ICVVTRRARSRCSIATRPASHICSPVIRCSLVVSARHRPRRRSPRCSTMSSNECSRPCPTTPGSIRDTAMTRPSVVSVRTWPNGAQAAGDTGTGHYGCGVAQHAITKAQHARVASRHSHYSGWMAGGSDTATTLLLIRHGEAAAAVDGISFPLVDGYSDPELAPQGHRHAAAVAERLGTASVTAVYVTPLQRTAQTAAPLAARLGVDPHVEDGLREVYMGEWEGHVLRRYIVQRHPVALRMRSEQRWDV